MPGCQEYMRLPVKVVPLDVTGNWVYRLCCSRATILGIQFLTDSFLAPRRIAATFLDFLQTVPVNFACWGKKKIIACFFSLIFNCLDSASPVTIVVSCSWRTEKVPDVDVCCCSPSASVFMCCAFTFQHFNARHEYKLKFFNCIFYDFIHCATPRCSGNGLNAQCVAIICKIV